MWCQGIGDYVQLLTSILSRLVEQNGLNFLGTSKQKSPFVNFFVSLKDPLGAFLYTA
jgi:hypothetical protein